MKRRDLAVTVPLTLLFAAAAGVGCALGPAATGSFDRTLNVKGPIRLELNNTSGDVSIAGTSDGKVHIHAEARASGMGFASPEKRVSEFIANPPIEQRGDTIRIGEEMRTLRNISVSYVIEVPRETEVSSAVLSGAQTIQDVRGPVKAEAASGSIRVSNIERQTQVSSLSGSIRADNIGDDLRANSASGTKTVSGTVQLGVPANANFHLAADAVSGEIKTDIPVVVEEQGKHSLRARVGTGGGRIEIHTISGEIRLRAS